MHEKQLDLFEDQPVPALEKDLEGRYFIRGKRKKTYILNISGKKFGLLTAIEPLCVTTYKDGSNKALWRFICDCGNSHDTTSNQVMTGKTKSCGCLKTQTAIDNSKNSRDRILKKDAALRDFYSSYKSGAKTRGLPFTLSLEDFEKITSMPCEYCGVYPYKTHKTKHSVYKGNGVDRVDNEEGYTLENSVPCCSICNHAKATLDRDVFINWAIDVADHQREKLNKNVNRSNSITDKVIEDLKSREKVGFRKYGRYLTTDSDEDMLVEVYEELQDALLYLKHLQSKRQAIYERDKK